MGQLAIEFDKNMEVSPNELALGSKIILPEIIRQLNEMTEKTEELIEKHYVNHYDGSAMSRVYWELNTRYGGLIDSFDDDDVEEGEVEEDVKSALILRLNSDYDCYEEEFPIDLRCGFDPQEIKGIFKRFRDAVYDVIRERSHKEWEEERRRKRYCEELDAEIRLAKERVWGTKRFSEVPKDAKKSLVDEIKKISYHFDSVFTKENKQRAIIKTLQSFRPDGNGSFTYTKVEPEPEPEPEKKTVILGNPMLPSFC